MRGTGGLQGHGGGQLDGSASGAVKGGKGKGEGACCNWLKFDWCRHQHEYGYCGCAHASRAGRKLCPEHFLAAGGCSADGACGLAHDVYD